MTSKTNKSSNGIFSRKIKQEPPDEQPFSPASQATESSQFSQISQRSHSSVRVKIEPVEKLECMKRTLEVNLKIQSLLEYETDKMKSLLALNQQKQAILKKVINEDEQQDKSRVLTQIRAVSVFAAPYFRDIKKMVPPPNEDTSVKRRNCDINGYLCPPRPWTPAEHKKLLDGITAHALLAALQPLKRDKDYIKRKMKSKNASDEDIEELKQELYICEQKIKLTNGKSLLELLGMMDRNIDWMTVSATNMEGIRTPEECETMWNNVLAFHINKDVFSEEEDMRLLDLAEEYKERNWDMIADSLKTERTAIQCFERYQNRLSVNLKKKYWTKEEDDRLMALVEEHRCGDMIPWNKLSLMMEGRTRQQIINRYERSISQKDNRYTWSPEEDGLLVGLYQKFGAKWNKMGSYFRRRSTYAIRERYCNALIPNVKVGPWSQEEDKKLISLVRKYGYGRWAKICKKLKGRTDNMCLIRAGRLLEWSVKYHVQRRTGEYDPNTTDPTMVARIMRPCAPSKYCPIRNEKLRSYRENGLKMLVKAIEIVAPDHKIGVTDLDSIDVSWMSSEMFHEVSYILHENLSKRLKCEMNPVAPLKYITKPALKRKRGEPEPLYQDVKPLDIVIPREEKELVDVSLDIMFEMQSKITPNLVKKTQNYGSRQCAEMSVYKSYLYKQFHCKALCDEDDDLEHVVFAKVDYRETLQTVISYFVQPPVYNNQFIVLAPNLTTMLAMETIQATENRLFSMSELTSHSKPYIDYLSERRKCCPKCLQCLHRSHNVTTSATPDNIMSDMNDKSFLVDEALESSAFIEGASLAKLNNPCSCKSLADSRNSVQLLRKRFLSLFLWPSFISSVKFGREQENVIINATANHDDDYLDMMDSKENRQKRKRRATVVKQTRKRRKRNDPENEKNPDDPGSEPILESDPNTEPNPKRKRTQLKIKSSRKISQPALRRSNRSSVLNRSSFAFTKHKGKKCTSKIGQDLASVKMDNSPSSIDGNLTQISEENVSDMSLVPEKKNRLKSRKSPQKTCHELPVTEIISDNMVSSVDKTSSLLQQSEDACDTSLSVSKNKHEQSCKSTSTTSNELVLKRISSDISPPADKINQSLLSEENSSDVSFLPETRNKRKRHKSALIACHDSTVSESVSQDMSPSADEIDSSLQLQEENRCEILSLSEKTNKRRSRKSAQKTNHELSVSEIISSDMPPSTDKKSNSSQLPEDSRCDILSLPEKKTKQSRKFALKSNHESSVSKIISSDMPLSTDEKSKFPEDSTCDILSLPEKKVKLRSRKSALKTNHETSASEIISPDIPTSTNENNSSFQLPEEKRCDILSLPKKTNKRKTRKAILKTNQESSLSENISQDIPPSVDEVNSSFYLPEENRYDILSLPEKKNRSRKSSTKTTDESSVSEIISSDMPPSAVMKSSSSQLPKDSLCGTVSLPEKKIKHRGRKSVLKTNHESSVSEIISSDIPLSTNENNNSSLLPEENRCDILSLTEKTNKRKSRKSIVKTNQESSLSEIISHDMPPPVNEINSFSQLPEKNRCDTVSLTKKKKKSHKSSTKNNDESSVSEIISSDMPPSTNETSNSYQLPEDNRCNALSSSKKIIKRRSRKSALKTIHESSVSEIISPDIAPSANEIDGLSQLPEEKRCDILSIPEKTSHKAMLKTSQELLLSKNISQDIPTSVDEVNSSFYLLEENRSDIMSLPEKKIRSRKSTTKTNKESPVSEIILHDMPLSTDENNSSSQLPEDNRCDTLSLPKKKNVRGSCESTLKINNELLSVEVASHDGLPSADIINSSSQLPEVSSRNDTSSLPEKRNTRSYKPIQKISNELPVMKVVLDNMSLLADKIDSSFQLSQEKRVGSPAPLERNKRKSRKPIHKTNRVFSASEIPLNVIPSLTSGISDISTIQEKRNNLSTLVAEIKTRTPDLWEKNMNTASALLNENADSVLLLSKQNEKNTSMLEDKKEKNVNDMPEIPDESSDRVFVIECISGAIILPEDNANDVSALSEKNCEDAILREENSVLSPEICSSPYVIQDEIEIASDGSSVMDDDKDSVIPISEENSILLSPEKNGNGSSVTQDKEKESDSDISPPDSVQQFSSEASIASPLAFLDRNSDSVEVLEERRNIITPEELTISSDSSLSQPCDAEAAVQRTGVNFALELSEKNICFK